MHHVHEEDVLPVQVWDQVYAQEMGPIPPVIHSPCCAEFVVSRERILAHPRCATPRTLRGWDCGSIAGSACRGCSLLAPLKQATLLHGWVLGSGAQYAGAQPR